MKKNKIVLFSLLMIVVASIFLNFYFWQEKKTLESDKKSLEAELEKLKDDYYTLDANLISLNDLNVRLATELEFFHHPDHKIFFLYSSASIEEKSRAIIVWNNKTKKVFISVENIPSLKTESDLQVWSRNDNKYSSVGFLLSRSVTGFIPMTQEIENPEEFIITLEPKGGSAAPTLSQLYLSDNP